MKWKPRNISKRQANNMKKKNNLSAFIILNWKQAARESVLYLLVFLKHPSMRLSLNVNHSVRFSNERCFRINILQPRTSLQCNTLHAPHTARFVNVRFSDAEIHWRMRNDRQILAVHAAYWSCRSSVWNARSWTNGELWFKLDQNSAHVLFKRLVGKTLLIKWDAAKFIMLCKCQNGHMCISGRNKIIPKIGSQ